MQPIITIEEAREILGADAEGMSDEELLNVIETLDLMAKEALNLAREKLQMKQDANDLAYLVYDIYQDKKKADKQKNS